MVHPTTQKINNARDQLDYIEQTLDSLERETDFNKQWLPELERLLRMIDYISQEAEVLHP